MNPGFSEDQLLLARTVRDFLAQECTPDRVRALWDTDTGRSRELWAKLAELGLPGLLVPEAHGGLGLDARDTVPVLEEIGRAALAEPIAATAAVAVPALLALEAEGRAALEAEGRAALEAQGRAALAREWLPRIAAGEAIVAVGHAQSPLVADAHVADLLLLPLGDELHALRRGEFRVTLQPANDAAQRLFSIDWRPGDATRVAAGEAGRRLSAELLDRGALACAAQLLGVADQLIRMGALYATQRKQFGVAIGSFQAVKHRLANAKVELEYSRALVHRAAHSVALAAPTRSADVSMAKFAAGEAATFAAGESLQVHGAIGYTYEQDLHVWMKRAWSLDLAFGSGAWHRARVGEALIERRLPAASFGFAPRERAAATPGPAR